MKYLDLLTEADRPGLSYEDKSEILQKVLDSHDPYLAYQVALRGFFVQEAQDIVCASSDHRTQIQFAKDVAGADWNAIGRAIARNTKPGISLYFAKNFQPTDITELQWRIILSDDPEYMRQFAQHVKNADVPLLERLVVQSRHSFQIFEFAKRVQASSLYRIGAAVHANMDPHTALLLATEVPGIDLDKMQDVILHVGSSSACYTFARRVRTANRQALQDRAVEVAVPGSSEDDAALFGFAKDIPGVDTGKLYATLIDTQWDHVAVRIRRYCSWYGKDQDIGLHARTSQFLPRLTQ